MGKRGRSLKYGALLACAALIVDFAASGSLVLWRYRHGHDYVTAAESMHLTRWLLFPFINRRLAELPEDVRYVGNLGLPSHHLAFARDWFVADPIYGWRLGKAVAASKPWWPQAGIRLTNHQGFASDGRAAFEYQRDKPDGVFRIVMLGGSTVEGDGVPHFSMNLPAQVRREIQRMHGDAKGEIEVINAGVGGYASAQEAAYFIEELLAYQPDIAVFYHGWNDLQYAERAISRLRRGLSPFRNEAHDGLQARGQASYSVAGSGLIFLQNVANRTLGSVAGFGLPTVGAVALGKLGRPHPPEPAAATKKEEEDFPEIYAAYMERHYAAVVAAATAAARRHGVAVAFLLQPLLGVDGKIPTAVERQIADARPEEMRRRRAFYAAARAAYADFEAEYGPTSEVCFRDLSATVFKGLAEPVYEDSGHLDPHGNAIAARGVAAALADCGMTAQAQESG